MSVAYIRSGPFRMSSRDLKAGKSIISLSKWAFHFTAQNGRMKMILKSDIVVLRFGCFIIHECRIKYNVYFMVNMSFIPTRLEIINRFLQCYKSPASDVVGL